MDAEERTIAGLLWIGTWIASAALAAGLLLASDLLMRGGVALFILLPVLRVLLMLVQFLGRRDRLHAAIALLVLVMIGAGMALGFQAG